MEQQENPTLNINDKEYVIEDLSDNAKYLISQIRDVQVQAEQTRRRMHQVQVTLDAYVSMLTTEVENPKEEA